MQDFDLLQEENSIIELKRGVLLDSHLTKFVLDSILIQTKATHRLIIP